MAVVRFLFYFMLCIILFVGILVAIVGGLWILRMVIDWWLDIDYVEKIKEWIDK